MPLDNPLENQDLNTPETPVYFVDRNFPCALFQPLVDAGYRIECHDAHLSQLTKDDQVIEYIATRGWILVTADDAIRRKHIPALKKHEPTVIFFTPSVSQMQLRVKQEWLLENWHRIDLKVQKLERGALLGISQAVNFQLYARPWMK